MNTHKAYLTLLAAPLLIALAGLPMSASAKGDGSATLKKPLSHGGSFAVTPPGRAKGPKPDYNKLDDICGNGNWIVTFDEDADGNAVPGSYNAECIDT